MKPHSPKIWRPVIVCAGLLLAGAALAQVPRQSVSANVPASARLAQAVGRMSPTERISMAISLPFRNQTALSNLLHQINDPASPNFRHYLTREQFTQRFGPTAADYETLKKFADNNGLGIRAEHANRLLLEVDGTVADIERIFHTTIRVYQHPTEARTFHAPATEPSLDVTVPVLGVVGMDDYVMARPHFKAVAVVTNQSAGQNASANSGAGPGGTYRGNDFRAAYVPDTTLTGSGQVVGLLQFDGYNAEDISYYEAQAGLPSVTLSNILLNGASGGGSGGNGQLEVSLDIEAAISMAPGLDQVMVYEAPNPSPFAIIFNRMVSDNAAKQLSSSWYAPGGSANPTTDQIFQEMAAQGQTFFNASGDNDAYTGLIDFPGDSPYITQVGGTTLNTTGPGGARVSETVWNHSGLGSGGGISTQYGIPDWQTNISMSANQGSTTMRNTPDVALTADNVYVRANGQDFRVVGTSCAAPLWAGFAALINQEAAASGLPPIGFINAAVDKIGSAANYTSCFYDVTTGDNTRSGSPNKFFAATGYDLCTGWGTPSGQSLINALANPEALRILPNEGFASAGGVGGPFTITSQDLSLTNAGTNSLTWTAVTTAPWIEAAPTSGTLSSDGSTIVTVSLNSAASNLTAGTYSAAVWFTNLNDQSVFERDYSLAIIDPPSIDLEPYDQAVLDGAAATFTVDATGGLPMFYQWRLNGNPLSDGGDFTGTTTATLTVSNVSSADLGTYTVVITNAAGSATSSDAVLSIANSQPVIIVPPTDQTVVAGRSVTFTVAAIGNKPFSYQWTYGGPGGTNINGATDATLVLFNVQLSDAGLYSVIVSNSLGATPSAYATLNVVQVPQIIAFSPTSGMPGTNVTISGVNFSSTAANDIVYFGAVKAVVTSASASSLTVTVPSGATFAPITVTVNGLIAFSDQPFLPIFPGAGQIDNSSLAPIVNLDSGRGPIRVAIADLNGDGKPDLVVASASDGMVSIYQNISPGGTLTTGSFAPRVTLSVFSSGGDGPYGLAVTDLDGDGKPDIIALDTDNNFVSIFRNISSDTTLTSDSFATRIDLPAGTSMRGVAVRDLNEDGKPEIVTANNGDDTISIFENQSTPGNISFANRVDIDGAAGPFAVAIADVDGDGNPDVVVVNNRNPGTAMSVWQNPGITGSISADSFLPRVDFAGNSAPEGLAVGDMDGDGKLDVVVCSPNGQTVSVYRNVSTPGTIGSDSFAAVVDFSGGGTVNTIGLADMDGDGRLDITSSAQGINIFSIFKNLSSPGNFTTGSLAARVDFSAGSNPNGLALGDLDGDGRPDAVFADFYDSRISIYQNTAQFAGFPTITEQPTNATVSATSNATFTVGVSGNPTLLYQWHFNNTIDIFGATNSTLTLTNVQFTNAGIYSVTVSNSLGSVTSSNALLTVNPLPSSIPIIMTVNPLIGNVGTMVTLGGSNFSDVAANDIVYFGAVRTTVNSASANTLTVTVPSGATFARITVTVNGLVGAANQAFVPTFPGAGRINASSLAPRVNLGTLGGPVPTVIADLDGDGKDDLIVGDVTSGNISIFRNISTSGSLSAGSFAPRVDLSMGSGGSSNPYSLTVGDLDGDGRLDIIAINADSKLVSIFRNISQPGAITTASFDARIDLASGNSMRGVTVGDLDGDGRLDIAAANNGDSTVSVFKNLSSPGNISFAARINYSTAAGTFAVGIADVDGDGKREIITVNNAAGSAGTVSVLKNVSLSGIITNSSFSAHVDFAGGSSAESLAIGDLDNDGKLDLVVGSPTGRAVYVYRNTSTVGTINASSFAAEVPFSAAGIVNSVAVGDMDGDGRIDITASTQNPGAFSIFKNTSTPGAFTSGSLAARVDFSAGGNANGVSLGDLDGDGLPEAIFSNFGEATLSIYRNVASNGFPPVVTSQPTNLLVSVRSNATFNVTASGSGPLAFQWYHNQTNSLLNATNSTLILTNVQVADAGLYNVTVSNLFGMTISSNASLTVTGFDHFAWSPIPSPRFGNAPFAVMIFAQDTTNATFTGFTGTVSLTSTNGVPVSPQVSGNFVGGVWTGKVTIAQLASGIVLRADDGAGRLGLANSIDIVSVPTVGMLNFGTSLLISWPVSPAGFVLENSPTLLPGTWTAAPGSPIPFNGQNLQSVPLWGTNQFFRLHFNGP